MIKKKLIIFLAIVFSLILILFFIRLLSPKEIDDVTLGMPCEQEYLEKSDVLWVIPDFNNIKISDRKFWCSSILELNKSLGMHGVKHWYREFETDEDQEYLQEGIDMFEECFGFKPEMFKPPQLKISEKNKQMMKNNNLKLMGNFNQLIHKVYHCDDSFEIVKNNVIYWI